MDKQAPCEAPEVGAQGRPLTLRVASDRAAAKAAWDRLEAMTPHMGAFATYAWHDAWFTCVAPDAKPAVLLAAEGDGNVVSLAPFCAMPWRDLGLKLPAFRFSGVDVVSADYMDLLAEPARRAEARALVLDHLTGVVRSGKLVVLAEIVRGSEMDEALTLWLARNGFRHRVQEERVCPYLDLPPTFDAYRASVSKNTRSLLGRRARQLEEAGCELRRIGGRDEVGRFLPRLFELHEARWRQMGETGTFIRPGFKEFLGEFVARAPASVEPFVWALYEKDQAIAGLLFFRFGDTVVYYQGGWDPASPHARLSPSFALMSKAIAGAIADGCKTFDFLRGDEGYKKKFTSTSRRTYTLLVAGGWRSRAYLSLLRLKDAVKRRLAKPAPSVWDE
ncbi:MAG TPA: GNAT family N-acetyltransferase [Planctomycetota bacterium]|nr:GNAT family N-acetyltransferase [Planctomycetota bacterium]